MNFGRIGSIWGQIMDNFASSRASLVQIGPSWCMTLRKHSLKLARIKPGFFLEFIYNYDDREGSLRENSPPASQTVSLDFAQAYLCTHSTIL